MTKQKFVDTDTKEAIEELLKVMDHQTAALWVADCTEHIIQYFEEKHPQDDRPRKAIEAASAWVQGEIGIGEARKVAFAAREALDPTAVATARAAGQTAATAHMFGHAIHASTYAVKSVAYATNFDAAAIANERTWQYQRLLDLS